MAPVAGRAASGTNLYVMAATAGQKSDPVFHAGHTFARNAPETSSLRSSARDPNDTDRKIGATKMRAMIFWSIGRNFEPGNTCSRPASRVCDIGAMSKPPTMANSAVRRWFLHSAASIC
eukprot:scaffold150154_cov33-Tisochrysis_lutea.AAC.2